MIEPRNTIAHGDAQRVLQEIPSDSIHSVVTSPPYWQQREYGDSNEIGQEQTIDDYVATLTTIGHELKRVLHEDGSLLLNLGDSYVDKKLQGIPHQVIETFTEQCGFINRRDIIWVKPNTKPDPARDRRATAHEYIFHLTCSGDYSYDGSVTGDSHNSIVRAKTGNSAEGHTAVFSEQLVSELLHGPTPTHVCGECQKPYARTYETVPRPFTDTDRPQSQRAFELYEESLLDEEHIKAIQSVGISDVGQAAETEDGAGRNADDVQELAETAKDVLGGYYREFTMTERHPTGWTQQCNCDAEPQPPVVADPFAGSGTTLDVARQQGYDAFGIELYDEYVSSIEQRVPGVTRPSTSGRANDQQSTETHT